MLIGEFADHIKSGEFTPARALFSERFQQRVNDQQFNDTMRYVQSHPTYGNLEGITTNDLSAAFQIEDQARIGFWDALIIQSAQTAGTEVLFSEDLSHGQTYGSVRVVDPFKNA